MNAARQKLGPDLVLQIANLPAQRRLRGVEPALGSSRQAAFLDRGHEIAQVPQLHPCSMPERYATSLQSLFQECHTSLELHRGCTAINRQAFVIKRLYASDGQRNGAMALGSGAIS